jgi:hypothetical protein
VKVFCLENKAAFPLYHGFCKKDIPEVSYYSLSAHALQRMQVSLGSVSNEGHLGEHTIFSFVSGLPKEGYSQNLLLTALALQPV